MDQSEEDWELILDIRSRMLLHWNYRNLNEIPPELIKNGSHIREIYFKRNCLTTLPPEIGALHNLTNLYLSGNMITHLPSEIGSLQALRVLELTQNSLRELPKEMGKLKFLEELSLTQNQIESLPSELMYLTNLKHLELSGNKLSYISPFIVAGLRSLEQLGMDGNPLNYLPRNVVNLKNLSYVSMCKCNLAFLPGVPFSFLNSTTEEDSQSVSTTSHKRFTILFDSNVNLEHIPHWIIQYIGSDFDCFGCARKHKTSEDLRSLSFIHSSVEVIIRGIRFLLCFDPDLCLIHNETVKTPVSLLETCLRNIHEGKLWKRNGSQLLPSSLEMLLFQGPTSSCFWCMKPIFREGWLLTFSPLSRLQEEGEQDEFQNIVNQFMGDEPHGIKVSSILFCGTSCFHKLRFLCSSSRLMSSLDQLQFIIQNEVKWKIV